MAIRGYREAKAAAEAEAAEMAVAVMDTPGAPDVPEAAADVTLPMDAIAKLVQTIEALFAKVDRDPDDHGATELLQQVLAQHSAQLKSTLSPENRLHPDISAYNPLGERDHPRPRLTRPCYFLGVPLDRATLDREEIELLNRITMPIEIPSRHWRVAFLRDGGGGEALYISVPFKGFDDLKGIQGGIKGLVTTLLAEGQRPQNQDLLFERIAALEEKLAARDTAAALPAPD